MNLKRNVQWLGAHKFVTLVLVVVILATIIGAGRIRSRTDGILSDPIQKGDISESVYGIGTVTANKIYRVMPGVTNTISQMWIKEGDTVKKGDKLIASESAVFRAPFDGTITSLPYKVGENIPPQIPALTLVDLTDRYLVVSLEQQGALRVKRNQKARISFDTIREKNYEGVVIAVYSNDINYLARIDIENMPERIIPGMTGDVAIEIEQHKNALLIPVAGLEQGKFVWRKRGSALPTQVETKTGIVDRAMAEVVSGDLEAGDQVLIRKKMKP